MLSMLSAFQNMLSGQNVTVIPQDTRDLSADVIDQDGFPRIMPAAYYASTTAHERGMLGHRHGIYGLPTLELVEFLKREINGRSAIEIGAGNGVLARALGIHATDSHQQQDKTMAAIYGLAGQPVVRYGKNVEKIDALAAIKKYRPQVVVACWVTHLYREDRHEAGGNAWGVDEETVIDSCEQYLFVGNGRVHRDKSIWARPHQLITPDWLYSRAVNGSADFVASWGGQPGAQQR